MMTDDEIIEVVQGHKNGKTIQFFLELDREWKNVVGKPTWNFDAITYRIKPEPKLRPYTYEEALEAWKLHKYVKNKTGHFASNILGMQYDKIKLSENFVCYQTLLDYYTWEDDTPCGILE